MGEQKYPEDANFIDPKFSQCAVLYLEHEDQKRRHRVKVVSAVNIGDFLLKYPVKENGVETSRRLLWNKAVETLYRIVAEAELTPKFVRNDKNNCRLLLKQGVVSPADPVPDEFYSLELSYASEFELEGKRLKYVSRIDSFNAAIAKLKAKLFSWMTPKSKHKHIQSKIDTIERERNFFIAMNPDPRELDSGLVFKLDMMTLKEFSIVKKSLQKVMNDFLAEMVEGSSQKQSKSKGSSPSRVNQEQVA